MVTLWSPEDGSMFFCFLSHDAIDGRSQPSFQIYYLIWFPIAHDIPEECSTEEPQMVA